MESPLLNFIQVMKTIQLFTQSISPASQDVAIGRPITPQAFSTNVTKTPEVFYDFKPLDVQALPTRQASTKVANLKPGQYPVPNSPGFKRLMDLQTLFCANDGKLVWQKLPKDMPLYYLTIAGVIAGVTWSLWNLKKFASPPSNK
ncbi:hypothetical protein Bpfe_014478 [Biomphalaria pfeifferi]|uniref:Uncharacterized protein n=1 Tax=Biomphalaria pfeifferi TaxID=112525 RepID=A0AAD8BKZ6_BIOPF|nr:hypothetical protein Bpfe_014478 [Biomphalaria pfeifferi]